MENLKALLSENGVDDPDKKKDYLIAVFSQDNLFFKAILKEIFLLKIKSLLGEEIHYNSAVEEVFPRSKRYRVIRELEIKTDLSFPEMKLSNLRMRWLLLSFAIPLVGILVLISLHIEFLLIPFDLFGLMIYLFIMTIPSISISLVWPSFFSQLDWPDIVTINDLLRDMAIDNWRTYHENNYSRTLNELRTIFEAKLKDEGE